MAALPEDGEVIVVDDSSAVPASEILGPMSSPALKVLTNPEPLGGGGSPSRNRGAQSARGDVLFFLDDDDEMIAEYCAQILGAPSQTAAFGFSARLFRSSESGGSPTSKVESRALPDGPISVDADYAERTFPFSAGFWITRQGYEKAGDFCADLATNSDTEYCLRMYSAGLSGWYSATPGVAIDLGDDRAASQLDNVTRRTKAGARARAFAAIAARHAEYLQSDLGAAQFVHSRWLKHAIRAGHSETAKEAIRTAPKQVQNGLRMQYVLKSGFRRLGLG